MTAVPSLMIAIVKRAGAVMSLTIGATHGMGPGMSDMSAFMSMKHPPIRQTNAAFPSMARPDSLIDALVSFNRPVIHGRTSVNHKMSAPMSPNRMLSGLIPRLPLDRSPAGFAARLVKCRQARAYGGVLAAVRELRRKP
jgi:hypothetical protein